ncbi:MULTISPECIES: DNA methyltransferase [unclassified Paenibacillus]|uniref:DNA methyltransferase n=1 Tax=unclassified Paenibacillus TaxID=185978 RepID=UPI002118A17F|nr:MULTISPECIES: DNA methyltransferase [unclassified Paenibacillus]
MADKVEQLEMLNENPTTQTGPVTCLGMTFENDEARRAYFIEELRKKLPELRKIKGFPIGEDEDILALSDPPYYTACPNPWIEDFVKEWEKTKPAKPDNYQYSREPFTADVSEGKNDPVYNAHSYHTKVPHKAVMRYILHYTEPGDIVFDGFCGTGMTGIAAQLCADRNAVLDLGYKVDENGVVYKQESNENGIDVWVPFSKLGARRAVLNDLSPAATFIAYNYNNPVDIDRFEREFEQILNQIKKDYGWMYETKHSNGKMGEINYTIWSDVFICPECTSEVVFWDVAVDKDAGKVKDVFFCPDCNAKLNKRVMGHAFVSKYDPIIKDTVRQAKQVPVLINYTYEKKRFEKIPDSFDLDLIEKVSGEVIPHWVPNIRLMPGQETRRNDPIGITHIHHFYTWRNLYVFSAFFEKCPLWLKWIVTGSLQRGSKQHQIAITRIGGSKAKEGGATAGHRRGTLYVPSNQVEMNAINLIADRAHSIKKALLALRYKSEGVLISTSSSTYQYADESNLYDYLFFDPPFGSNISYSELNSIQEGWLKVFTNRETEAIEDKFQKKTLQEYFSLMKQSFSSAYKLLKPGRWMTVEFSNTSAAVWNVIQTALQEAGFIVANVSTLDKKRGGLNAIVGTTAVNQDLAISAYKPKSQFIEKINKEKNTDESVWSFVNGHLNHLPVFIGNKGVAETIVERTPRVLFDRMVAYHVQQGFNVPLSSWEFQKGLEQRFPIRDGMVFLETQVPEYDKKRIQVKEFAQLNLFISDENSAIEWLRQQLLKKPQTRQDLHPNFMKEIQHIAKHELLPELDVLLEQNFLKYDGEGEVPSQIHAYLSSDYKDLRNLSKNDPKLKEKAKDRWYVPDPNKQADLEKLREKSLLREFNQYVEELSNNKKKLKQFRTEAIRVGFHKAWTEKDYKTIVEIGNRLPESILQEDEKLLRYYDNAQTKLGL